MYYTVSLVWQSSTAARRKVSGEAEPLLEFCVLRLQGGEEDNREENGGGIALLCSHCRQCNNR